MFELIFYILNRLMNWGKAHIGSKNQLTKFE